MTLQQLHQVITIAESKSMNEAARKLFVSQPNLSSVVRELEEEAGITIFIRSNRGIVMTPEGEEFIGYAKQVVEQYHLLEKRYMNSEMKKKFSVSMQHYSFAVKAFVEMVKSVGMEEYEFAIHETQTNQVIENVRSMKSELGVLFISEFNEAVLLKLFKEYDLEFEELFASRWSVQMPPVSASERNFHLPFAPEAAALRCSYAHTLPSPCGPVRDQYRPEPP